MNNFNAAQSRYDNAEEDLTDHYEWERQQEEASERADALFANDGDFIKTLLADEYSAETYLAIHNLYMETCTSNFADLELACAFYHSFGHDVDEFAPEVVKLRRIKHLVKEFAPHEDQIYGGPFLVVACILNRTQLTKKETVLLNEVAQTLCGVEL